MHSEKRKDGLHVVCTCKFTYTVAFVVLLVMLNASVFGWINAASAFSFWANIQQSPAEPVQSLGV